MLCSSLLLAGHSCHRFVLHPLYLPILPFLCAYTLSLYIAPFPVSRDAPT